MDGNRRWARRVGLSDPILGHRHGAAHVSDLLGWCETAGIRYLTLFVCSTENLQRRADHEIAHLMRLMEEVVAERLAGGDHPWRLHLAGRLDLLPPSTAHALMHARDVTSEREDHHLTLAIGYGGRQEVTDAARALLTARAAAGATIEDVAENLGPTDLSRHPYVAGQPDVELVIRTSGERRLSNWLLWQSTHAELVFSDVYWPGFDEADLLSALVTFVERRRVPSSTT